MPPPITTTSGPASWTAARSLRRESRGTPCPPSVVTTAAPPSPPVATGRARARPPRPSSDRRPNHSGRDRPGDLLPRAPARGRDAGLDRGERGTERVARRHG